MSDPRIPRLWTLDQALIWYVTRDLELAQEADPDTKRGHRLGWTDLLLDDAFEALDWRRAEADFHDLLADNRHLTKAGSSEIEEEWFDLGRFERGDGELRLARVPGHTSEDIGRAGLNLEYLKSPQIKVREFVALLASNDALKPTADEPAMPLADEALEIEPEPEPLPAVKARIKPKQAVAMAALTKAFPNGIPSISEMDNASLLLCVKRVPGVSFSEKTLLRAAGRSK